MTVMSEGNSQISVMHKRSTTKDILFLIDLILKSPQLKGFLEKAMRFFEEPKSVTWT